VAIWIRVGREKGVGNASITIVIPEHRDLSRKAAANMAGSFPTSIEQTGRVSECTKMHRGDTTYLLRSSRSAVNPEARIRLR